MLPGNLLSPYEAYPNKVLALYPKNDLKVLIGLNIIHFIAYNIPWDFIAPFPINLYCKKYNITEKIYAKAITICLFNIFLFLNFSC